MNLQPVSYADLDLATYRMGELRATPEQVASVLGFPPNESDSIDGKARNVYVFKADDKPMSCWQYRGAKAFSIWGDLDKWATLFRSRCD